MYAIIDSGGKQYRVEPGTVLRLEKLDGEVGHTLELTRVRLVQDDQELVVGRPWIEQCRVTAQITRQGRTRSIRVFKKKRRKNYQRTKGHRQAFTEIRVTDIVVERKG